MPAIDAVWQRYAIIVLSFHYATPSFHALTISRRHMPLLMPRHTFSLSDEPAAAAFFTPPFVASHLRVFFFLRLFR